MIIVLKPNTSKEQADEIQRRIEAKGLKPLYLPGTERVVLGAIGDERVLAQLHLEGHPQVESVKPILSPHKLVGREFHPHDSIVKIAGVPVGGERFVVIAGPCAVESYQQMTDTAKAVKSAGAAVVRGGAFKPRTSPYAFQGLGVAGLEILHKVSKEQGIPYVTEVVEVADVELVAKDSDALQVGARNMQNYRLLSALGHCGKPVLLKRGPAAELKELLLAAEYIVNEGNPDVIFCERGIRTFETATRNTLDLNAVPFLKQRSHLPVMVDPSHGTGVRSLVTPMARAAVAAGADGILVEVHVDPSVALSDGAQSLYPQQFAELMEGIKPFVQAAGRTL
ncbi:MAG: 3-deoxy-7-phosphoheptulonate synthase [Deltaproteobacteria bacterium]|nr:3-deoxy-7-phosphoheptulonate synthase [Deltaproteobacteria bacterium]